MGRPLSQVEAQAVRDTVYDVLFEHGASSLSAIAQACGLTSQVGVRAALTELIADRWVECVTAPHSHTGLPCRFYRIRMSVSTSTDPSTNTRRPPQ